MKVTLDTFHNKTASRRQHALGLIIENDWVYLANTAPTYQMVLQIQDLFVPVYSYFEIPKRVPSYGEVPNL